MKYANGEIEMASTAIDLIGWTPGQQEKVDNILQALDKTLEDARNQAFNHSDCIPRSSLPRLPEYYVKPFKIHHHDNWEHCWQVTDQETQLYAECESKENAEHLVALLNAVYGEVV